MKRRSPCVRSRWSSKLVNMIADRGSGVLHMCVVGGHRSYATCLGNSSCGEVNVADLGSGCFGKAE